MKYITARSLTSLALSLVLALSACTPAVVYRVPTYAEITPGPHKVVGDLSTTIEVPPSPYSTPLPPAVPTSLDGLYSKRIPSEGTPVPCTRCAGYRLEGGLWTLYLNQGVFKVFQQDTDFEAVGSYTVSGNQLTLFNDPYCEEDLKMVGTYTWAWDARNELRLTAIQDSCSIGLRAKNMTSDPWVKTPVDPQERTGTCQPPNREAGVSDHWDKPPYCP